METLRLAYRDDDQTPVIYCIREMALRHYETAWSLTVLTIFAFDRRFKRRPAAIFFVRGLRVLRGISTPAGLTD
jgi:hypothetical protein